MRFLVDECTGSKVARWLRGENYGVFSVFDEVRGMTDDEVLTKAFVRGGRRKLIGNADKSKETKRRSRTVGKPSSKAALIRFI